MNANKLLILIIFINKSALLDALFVINQRFALHVTFFLIIIEFF